MEKGRALRLALVEPTPTIEEFVYSFLPTQTVPRNLEGLFYLDAKLFIAFYPAMLRVAYLMGYGYTLAEATFIAGDSYALLSVMKKIQTVGRTSGAVIRTFVRTPGVIARNPIVLAPILGIGLAQATMRDPHFQKTGVPKFGIPLPIWLMFVSEPSSGNWQVTQNRNSVIANFYSTGGHGFFFA